MNPNICCPKCGREAPAFPAYDTQGHVVMVVRCHKCGAFTIQYPLPAFRKEVEAMLKSSTILSKEDNHG